jgi:hypothetical protein
MPKVEKKRSAVDTYAAKITPQKKLAQAGGPASLPSSASTTPPPSPGAEQRAKEEWLSRRAALQARIEAEQAQVLAGLEKLRQLKPNAAAGDGVGGLAVKNAESLLAYGELRKYGKENIFPILEQPNPFIDSSSEDSDAESESGANV